MMIQTKDFYFKSMAYFTKSRCSSPIVWGGGNGRMSPRFATHSHPHPNLYSFPHHIHHTHTTHRSDTGQDRCRTGRIPYMIDEEQVRCRIGCRTFTPQPLLLFTHHIHHTHTTHGSKTRQDR